MRMSLAGHQFARALATAFGASAVHEAPMGRSLICALTRSYAEAHNGGADLAIRPSFFSTAMNSDQ
jgi:hypothetical protein